MICCKVSFEVYFPKKIGFQFSEIEKGGQIPLSLLEKAIRQSTRIPPFGLIQSHLVSSHAVPSCSWLESLRASRPSLTSPRLIVASRIALANAQRNAGLALRRSPIKSIISYTNVHL